MRLCPAWLAALLLTASAAAHTSSFDPQPLPPAPPQPSQPVFRTGVELLSIDVTVTDGDGRQVTDLTPAEFVVEIDGRPRPVVTAEYVRLVDDEPVSRAPRPAAVAEPPAEEEYFSSNTRTLGRGRHLLLLVDRGNIRAGQGRGIMRSAVTFVNRLSPADRVALVAVPGPGPFVDFTTDHDKIREGLLQVVGAMQRFRGRFNISLSEAMATVERSDSMLRLQLMLRECGDVLSQLEAARCELDVEQEAAEIVAQQRHQTHASLGSIREVLRSLARLEGPKSVILISEGLVLEGLTGDVDDLAAVAADVRASLDVLLVDVPMVDASESRRPTTPREDRALQVQGLEALAGAARGGLHRVITSGDQAFARILRAISGHYLLGVEAQPSDRDGRRHRIQVRSTRRGVSLYSRRGFLASTSPGATSPADAVQRALRAPLTLNDVPIRLATWTYKEPGGSGVRLLIAAEVERLADQALDYTTGLLVVDDRDRAVAGGVDTRQLAASETNPGVATFSGALAVEPGTYLLRFAVADSEGRIGSVERKLQAWNMDAPGLTVSDLLVAAAPSAGQPLTPSVVPGIAGGDLAALMEVYAPRQEMLHALEGALDILPSEDAPPLTSGPLHIVPGSSPEMATVQGRLSTAALPPGRYLARATIAEGGQPRGHFVRPFQVLPRSVPTDATAPPATRPGFPVDLAAVLLGDLPAFDREAVLAPSIVASVLSAAERARPTAKAAFALAHAGRMGPAALAALEAGDQAAAAFLRGVDFFQQGQIDRALQQLQVAMQQAPAFDAARFYLGAALASSNRDREAAGLLQSVAADVAGRAPRQLAGLTWLRAGHAALAIESLEALGADLTADSAAQRALALAYVVTDRPADALPLLARHLEAHPADQAALLAGIYAVYATHTPAHRGETIARDRDRARGWATAYTAAGDSLQALVDAWMTYLEGAQ